MRKTLVVLLLVLAGCADRGEQPGPAPAPAIKLAAKLTTPVDIDLSWTGVPADVAGQIVEFATAAKGPWTIIEFVSADRRTFRHPDLLPRTPFYYRVRPVLGAASAPVDVTLGAPSFDPPADLDASWAEPRPLPDAPPGQPGAAPTALAATAVGLDAVKLTWRDNASDEEGYLVEIQPRGARNWSVAMALDPNIASAGLTVGKKERNSALRVRAYRYGAASNVMHLRTGGQLD
jgi:hypothetical protein